MWTFNKHVGKKERDKSGVAYCRLLLPWWMSAIFRARGASRIEMKKRKKNFTTSRKKKQNKKGGTRPPCAKHLNFASLQPLPFDHDFSATIKPRPNLLLYYIVVAHHSSVVSFYYYQPFLFQQERSDSIVSFAGSPLGRVNWRGKCAVGHETFFFFLFLP